MCFIRPILLYSENIFGYKDLRIDFWMCASSLKTFIQVNYLEKVDKAQTGGVDADEVIEPLTKILAEGQVLESKDQMTNHLSSPKVTQFKPLGSKVDEFQCGDQSYEIFHAEDSVPGFREYHSKLQPWIMFYIDAASYIDIDDANWRFFLV